MALITASIASRLDEIITEAQRIKASLYCSPSTSIRQLDQDLDDLAEQAKRLSYNQGD